MLKKYEEGFILRHLKYKNKTKHPTFCNNLKWFDVYSFFKFVEYRALILLSLLYPDGISNYVIKPYMIPVFYYVPSRDLYIDYFEFLSHSGPYNEYRIFNPLNKNDIDFIKEVRAFNKKQQKRYWLSVDRCNTWANVDYKKFLFMKIQNKKYVIFWTIKELEEECTESMINTSWETMDTYKNAIDLQNIVYEPINLLYNKKYETNNKNYLSYCLNI